jgi:nicotinate-nucleotide pyrophosphorylase (carboxylating)
MNFDEQLDLLISSALKEDIGDGDQTTLSCIPSDINGKAHLKIKQDGILAGMAVAQRIFSKQYPGSVFTSFKKDGDPMKAGEIAFEIEAPEAIILQCERVVLNCMQRMSGIATLTRTYVEKLKGYKTRVLDTRKSTPNFRLLEKEAVRIGGGVNNRFGLFDMIMLKDNHIDYCGGIEQAVSKAWEYVQVKRPDLKIEVEARTLDDVNRVIEAGRGKVFRIMLDNFTPQQVEAALLLIGSEFETEASGGINLENVEAYARTGVDYVSVGGLIHQARSLDLSLKAVIQANK